MSERSPFTFREAALSSLLLHACLIIVVLLFPDLFATRREAPVNAAAEQPIPMTFLEDPGADESPPVHMGDRGDRDVSDPRPETAPEPENEDPYAAGNTPNRFVAPPVADRASPEPGPQGEFDPPVESLQEDTGRRAEAGGGSSGRQTGPSPAVAGTLSVPSGQEGRSGDGAPGGGGPSLRETLGRMSLGISGGSPLRFDNPAGGISGPRGGLSFDTPDFDWGPYARRIYWIIWTNWTQGWPPAAWAGLQGVVTVRFRIWRDGSITDIVVEAPSGTPAFDTCASIALEASSPLPPLPADFPKESEGITARFFYNMNAMER